MPRLEELWPRYLEEIRGIAAEAGVDFLRDILAVVASAPRSTSGSSPR